MKFCLRRLSFHLCLSLCLSLSLSLFSLSLSLSLSSGLQAWSSLSKSPHLVPDNIDSLLSELDALQSSSIARLPTADQLLRNCTKPPSCSTQDSEKSGGRENVCVSQSDTGIDRLCCRDDAACCRDDTPGNDSCCRGDAIDERCSTEDNADRDDVPYQGRGPSCCSKNNGSEDLTASLRHQDKPGHQARTLCDESLANIAERIAVSLEPAGLQSLPHKLLTANLVSSSNWTFKISYSWWILTNSII